jgi:hypothetical protein
VDFMRIKVARTQRAAADARHKTQKVRASSRG